MPALSAAPAVPGRRRPERAPAIAPAMARSRQLLVVLLIAVIAGGQLYDTVVDGDHWPFSSYPMFAQPREGAIRMKRLYGVTASGGELPIVVPRHLAPFHEARLMTAFKRIGRRGDRDAHLDAALRGTLELYERRRSAGAHDGPALSGLRLYVVSWAFQARAANKETPAERRLLAEVWH